MTKDIYCFSKQENARVFQSLGIEVVIFSETEKLRESLKKTLNNNVKIVIIDEEIHDDISDIRDKYDEVAYPIFLTLPLCGKSTGQSLKDMKKTIEQAIGLSMF